jgi:hypothetical protein
MPPSTAQNPQPHPWTREINLLLEQSLTFLQDKGVSAPALSRAKYHQRQAGDEPPFYLRLFAGDHLGDQITLRFSPSDDLNKRRCSLSLSVKQITQAAVQPALAGALAKQGFTQMDAATPDPLLFSNGSQTLEIHLFFKNDNASIRIQSA